MSSRGMSSVIGVVLFTGIVTASSGVVMMVVDSQTDTGDVSGEVANKLSFEKLEISYFKERGNLYRATVRNFHDSALEADFYHLDRTLNKSVIPPGETKSVELGCLYHEKDSITVASGDQQREKEVNIPLADFEGIAEGYCINITDTEIVDTSSGSYKVWKGEVFLNDRSKTPYVGNLRVRFDDQEERIVSTDSQGKFEIREGWDTKYVETNQIWKKKITYRDSTETVNFHLGRGKFQPPNRLRLDYEDDVSRVYETQQVFEGLYSDHVNMTYDVVPVSVNDNSMELRVEMNVEAGEGLEEDWNNNPDSRLLYQVPIAQGNGYGGPFADVLSLSCESEIQVDCRTGETQVTIDSPTSDKQFEWENLPTDSGQKYIPFKHRMQVNNGPFVGALSPNHYFHHGGSTHNNPDFNHKWYFRDNTKRMVYMQPGQERIFFDNITLDRLENDVESEFSDPEATINTTYQARQDVVTSALGWWMPPEVVDNHVYYSLENPPEFSSEGGASSSLKRVMYEWNDVTAGETYGMNFTVKLSRHSDDRSFMLPVHMGTFGMFPQNGGESLPVGERYGVFTDGMVRYPGYRKTGRWSFKTTIPGTGTSKRAMVYKITLPGENDKWTSKTYVLNVANERIENIYLLNSQGQWETFETSPDGDDDMAPGEVFSSGFDVEENEGKKVQMNLQYQSINGGAEAPEYSGWPYTFFLNISGENEYDYDISGDVNCGTRHCLSYRIGNAEESRPIDNLRGPDAGHSIFNEKLDRVDFRLKNNDNDPDVASQRLKLFKFWVWIMQPFSNNLGDQLSNPENLTIKTIDHDEKRQGILVRDTS